MSDTVNSYERHALKEKLKKGMAEGFTKEHIKYTAVETVKDLAIGVVAGGLVGAAIGKPSLLAGLGVTGIGHFTGHRWLSVFGVGIMAANGFQNKSLNGMDGLSMDAVKSRLTAYKDSFSEKLYLDKVMKPKTAAATATNGVGALQFFNYPNDRAGEDLNGSYNELNGALAALDSIEQQVEDSGIAHMQMNGMYDTMEGAGINDASDYNL